uniref:Uncharacterized protein LOC100373320 n=1 Tax=Saccoglossus kowalevskii TaxID=10224 RepID=A0ABM0MBC9_SACKO|nr:PREDICTED: uncharacterized protein LOC100373320 [Saccoglossus kowalevskii]
MWAYILDLRGVKLSGALPILAVYSVASRRFHLVPKFQGKFVHGSTDERRIPHYKERNSRYCHLHQSISKYTCEKSNAVESVKTHKFALYQHHSSQSENQLKLRSKDNLGLLPVLYLQHKNEVSSLSRKTSLPIVFQANRQQSLISFMPSVELKNAAKKLTDLIEWLHVQDIVHSVGKVWNESPDDIIIRHHPTFPSQDNSIISWENHPVTMIDCPFDNYLTFNNSSQGMVSMDATKVKYHEQPDPDENNNGRPSKEQLAILHHKLSDEMPNFYEKPHDFSIYSANVEFDNRLIGVKTKGKSTYQCLVQTLKYSSLIYLVDAELEVLKLTINPEESNIRYYDALSTFYVGNDGLIHVHKIDKVMPDSQVKEKVNWLTKLRWAMGITRPAYGLPQ